MADHKGAISPMDRPMDHLATAAWRSLAGSSKQPAAVEVLKENWKTCAYRLVGCGPDGGDVVATRRPTAATLVERRVYADILSRTSVPNVRLLGVTDEDDGTSWMFLDDAGEEAPDLRSFEGRELAGTWLGKLHDGLGGGVVLDRLPDRGSAEALRALQSSRDDLRAALSGRHVPDADDRSFIRDLVARLDRIGSAWERVDDQVRGLPSTLVHADFVAKNMRIRRDSDGSRSIVAFDWEMSGSGVPLRDLAWVDIGAYAAASGRFWGARSADLDRLADLGRLFSLLAAIDWEMLGLLTAWPRRYLARLRVFHERLGTVVARSGVGASTSRPSGRTRPGDHVEDGASDGMGDRMRMVRGLGSMEPFGPTRIIDVVEQAPNVYQSTFPSTIVRCAFDDGVERRIFVKRHLPGLHAGGRFWDGGSYEADVYRDLLSAGAFGAPEYYGSWADPEHGDSFLVIGYLDGWRLSRSEPRWLVEAARRLARLHRGVFPIAARHPAIRRYDEAFFAHRSRVALTALRRLGVGSRWREALFRAFDEVMIPRLLGAEPSFVHGEPYPQNIIVSDGHVRIVDWQSAAIGAGAIDVACLTIGRWPADLVAEAEAAYVSERWVAGSVPPTFQEELIAARLYWSMRWLGADIDATTETQREADVEDLWASAERLGLVSAMG